MSAKLRILAFDTPPNALFTKRGGAVISSVAELFTKLRESKGEPDKPVRILVEDATKVVLVAKFGFGEDLLRQPCIADEYRNQQLLIEANIASPHLALMKWGGCILEEGNSAPSCVVCTEYITQAGDFHTLRQLAKSGTDDLWRMALFQVLFTLLNLQARFGWFRHNDLKADNILVTDSPLSQPSYCIDATNDARLVKPEKIRRVWSFEGKIWAKIIDFELAMTEDCKALCSRAVMNGDGGNLERDYGLAPRRCDAFDVHLLFFDALQSSKGSTKHKDFQSFVFDFFSPDLFFALHLTPQCRLRVEEQESLQKHCDRLIERMLAHPYFFQFRRENTASANFTIFT